MAVDGYIKYAKNMLLPEYTEEQMDQIIAHRKEIFEKYRMTEGISRKELTEASDNYKKLSDEQAADVLVRVANSSVTATNGAAYTGNFFLLSDYDGVIVDVQDVFAVGFTSDSRYSDTNVEGILCAVFTNDPYIPVFPMLYVGKLGFFEIMKSRKGRKGVSAMFELMCPNLQYPVQDIKQLKKQIKADGAVKGNLDSKFMLDAISSVTAGSVIFNTKHMTSTLWHSAEEMLESYGYLMDTRINEIMKMDEMLSASVSTPPVEIIR